MIKETPHIRITAGIDVKAKRRQRVLRYLLNRIIIELAGSERVPGFVGFGRLLFLWLHVDILEPPAIAPAKPVCLNIVALLAGLRLSRLQRLWRRFAQPLLLPLVARQALAGQWV